MVIIPRNNSLQKFPSPLEITGESSTGIIIPSSSINFHPFNHPPIIRPNKISLFEFPVKERAAHEEGCSQASFSSLSSGYARITRGAYAWRAVLVQRREDYVLFPETSGQRAYRPAHPPHLHPLCVSCKLRDPTPRA